MPKPGAAAIRRDEVAAQAARQGDIEGIVSQGVACGRRSARSQERFDRSRRIDDFGLRPD